MESLGSACQDGLYVADATGEQRGKDFIRIVRFSSDRAHRGLDGDRKPAPDVLAWRNPLAP